jgi:hypothetical protein
MTLAVLSLGGNGCSYVECGRSTDAPVILVMSQAVANFLFINNFNRKDNSFFTNLNRLGGF